MASSAIISAGIQAAGGIAQSLLGKKPRTYGPGEILRKTVGEARELGIHPLAALGTVSPYTGSAPVSIGDGLGDAAKALGQGLERDSDNKQKRKDQAAESAVTNRLVDAQIKEIESATALNVARAQSIMTEATRQAKQPASGYGRPDRPGRSRIVQGEGTHKIFGVPVPKEMAQVNEDAGGDALGGGETLSEYVGHAMDYIKAKGLIAKGHVCVQNDKTGKWFCSAKPIRRKNPKDRSGAHPYNQ